MKRIDDVLKDIGKRLEKLRVDSGYTSYENFAIKNDMSRMHYWRIEKGKSNMTIKSLLVILNIHGITLEEFFSDKHKVK